MKKTSKATSKTKHSAIKTTIRSSLVSRFHYTPKGKTLTIQMVDGSIYFYTGIPKDLAARFKESKSKGGFFNRHIKGQFRSDKA